MRSPLHYVANVTTPTMVMTGEADLRTPMSQSEEYYRALKMLRKADTLLVRMPEEFHGWRRPSHQLLQQLYLLAWFEKYRTKASREPVSTGQPWQEMGSGGFFSFCQQVRSPTAEPARGFRTWQKLKNTPDPISPSPAGIIGALEGGPMRRLRMCWLAVLVCASVLFAQGAPSRTALAQEKPPDSADAKKPEGLALKTAETLEFDDRRSDVDVARRLAGRPHHRVRPARRPLHDARRRRQPPRRIVGGLSFESQPTFSPDGKTIAFLSDRTGVENLWIANADGTNPRAVSKDEKTNDRPQIMASPAWTPDGEFIVVSKARAPDPGTFWLFMYHRDGGTGVRVGAAAATAAVARRGARPAAARRPPIAWAPSSLPTAASSTTRSARAASPTTPASRSGRSIATTARPATRCR